MLRRELAVIGVGAGIEVIVVVVQATVMSMSFWAIALGYAIGGALIVGGLVALAWSYRQGKRLKSVTKEPGVDGSLVERVRAKGIQNSEQQAAIDWSRLDGLSEKQIAYVDMVSDDLYLRHGHFDLAGLLQDLIEGKPLPSGICHECGRPRNEAIWKAKNPEK